MDDQFILIEVTTQRSTMTSPRPRVKVAGVGTYEQCTRLEELLRKRNTRWAKKSNRSNIEVEYSLFSYYPASSHIQELESREPCS